MLIVFRFIQAFLTYASFMFQLYRYGIEQYRGKRWLKTPAILDFIACVHGAFVRLLAKGAFHKCTRLLALTEFNLWMLEAQTSQ